MPHYVDINLDWVEEAKQSGCLIVDPRTTPDDFAVQIQRCDVVLSSSLHGIIFAHSFGIPAAWIELSNGVIGDGFKFFDYYASCGVRPEDVRRLRVQSVDSPVALASMATVCSQNHLVQSVLQGMSQARPFLGL